MKCENCRELLEEYLDGELKDALAAKVKAHVSDCAPCSNFYEELRQEQVLYARYQRDIEVTPALWAGVEARIRQEKIARPPSPLKGLAERFRGLFGTPRFSPALAAALVVMAVGLTVLVMSWMNSRNNNQPIATGSGEQQTVAPRDSGKPEEAPALRPDANDKLAIDKDAGKTAPAEKPNKPAAERKIMPRAQLAARQADPAELVREAEQKYLRAIAILSRDVNRRRSQIDPTVLARFDTALSDIDRAINDTRRVVREHPDDPVALQYLLSAYAKKVDALREMALD